jgi:hypothetical protein
MKLDELPSYARKAYDRLAAGSLVLVRTSNDSDEAVLKGGGFLFSTEPGGRKFPTASAKMLIDNGLVEPNGDGLLAEVSQTFHVAA